MIDPTKKIEPFGKKVKDKKEEESKLFKNIFRPESTFTATPPKETSSEEPKPKGVVRSIIENEVVPALRGSAEEVASLVLERYIAPSEAPRFFADSLKANVKERGRQEIESFVNSALEKINKKLPFDLVYSSREMMPSGPRSADMTVTEKVGPEWMERARKLGMIK